ncbi:MAG: hypothetical protein KC502_06940 [Myxococcales bacterium]|nr:hypothetical protein [Myxococcales bacterium]
MSKPTFRMVCIVAAMCALSFSCETQSSSECDVGFNLGGSNPPPTIPIEMGRRSGSFDFDYETRNAMDRIEVFYEGELLFDSGCVSESRSVPVRYGPGKGTKIDVVVTPNCDGGIATSWKFSVGCPVDSVPSVKVNNFEHTK